MSTKNYYNATGIEVRYLGATNTQGSRVKATLYHDAKSITFGFMYEHSSIVNMLNEKLGLDPICFTQTKTGYMVIYDIKHLDKIRAVFGVKYED